MEDRCPGTTATDARDAVGSLRDATSVDSDGPHVTFTVPEAGSAGEFASSTWDCMGDASLTVQTRDGSTVTIAPVQQAREFGYRFMEADEENANSFFATVGRDVWDATVVFFKEARRELFG